VHAQARRQGMSDKSIGLSISPSSVQREHSAGQPAIRLKNRALTSNAKEPHPIEKVFGVKMETLMQMQSAFDIASTRSFARKKFGYGASIPAPPRLTFDGRDPERPEVVLTSFLV
jgi:hypothetical protein